MGEFEVDDCRGLSGCIPEGLPPDERWGSLSFTSDPYVGTSYGGSGLSGERCPNGPFNLDCAAITKLPEDAAREVVLLRVELDEVGDAGKLGGQRTDERVRVDVDFVQVREVHQLHRRLALEAAVGQVEVGDALARPLGRLDPGPLAPVVLVTDPVSTALEANPLPVPVVAARVVRT